jgi:dihydropteroate synthase
MSDYLRPIPILDAAPQPDSLPLVGGPLRFSMVERLRRDAAPEILPVRDVPAAALAPLTAPRAAIAGLDFTRPRLMGILNVTPDSFSDGGRFDTRGAALARARAMLAEGADLLDIGGESTRPGASETPAEVELARVAPVIADLRAGGITAPLSLDTRKSSVAQAAGADILNDVSGLRFDPALATVAAQTGAPLILMHSIGTPETMQALAPDAYDAVLLDVFDALAKSIAVAEAAGVPRQRIMVDPGIGFGKTDPQQIALLRRISLFHGLGCAILLGVSRKGMIGRISGEQDAARRGPGSAGIGLWAVGQGIQMLRIHDVALHKQAIDLWWACAWSGHGMS